MRLLNHAGPFPTIRWPANGAHADSMICGIAPGIATNDDVVAGLQGVSRDAFPAQLASATPSNRPGLGLALVIGSLNMNERMWIPEQELYQFSFHRDGLVLKV